MSGRNTSARVQADHCRELAQWTSDERTQHILLDLARELDAADGAGSRPADEIAQPPVPPSLS